MSVHPSLLPYARVHVCTQVCVCARARAFMYIYYSASHHYPWKHFVRFRKDCPLLLIRVSLSPVDQVYWILWAYTGSLIRQHTVFWFQLEMVLTPWFLLSKFFSRYRISEYFQQFTFYFICLLKLWSLCINIWLYSELSNKLLFLVRNIFRHLPDIGLVPPLPYTGWEVNYFSLHLGSKLNPFYCSFEFN
jgi:hypothetical protein